MTWTPVLFTRNSGDLVRTATSSQAVGSDWYMLSEVYGKQTPSFKRFGNFLDGIKEMPSKASVPWIMETRNNRVFVGEYMMLHARLNVNGKQHPYALDGMRGIHCLYGFEAEIGKEKIPSYEDMRRMSAAWREELSHLVTELNEHTAETCTNREHLRGLAKTLPDLMPDGGAVGTHYADNLWDHRARQVNSGEALERPLLVNAVEYQHKHYWADHNLVEVDGAAQKKTASEMAGTLQRLSTKFPTLSDQFSALGAKGSAGSGRSFRPSAAFMTVSGVILGGTIGVWAFQHHLQQKRKLEAQRAEPAVGR